MPVYNERFHLKSYDAGGAFLNVLNKRFGGVGDGSTEEDAAIVAALADIPAAGGGIIFFPGMRKDGSAATYLIDNVDLAAAAKKNVKFWVGPGATLKKRSTTVTHMFTALQGDLVDGLTFWIDGTVDLNRSAFAAGNTVSLLFAVRTNGLRVIGGGLIKDGIEEGLKLYKCQRVRIGYGLRIFNTRNNGVQLNAPANDSYPGGGARADQDVDDVLIDGLLCEDIFDELGPGWPGEGQAIGMGDGTVKTCKNVTVRNVTSRNCIRGVWGEFNVVPGENISIEGCPVYANKFHGHGLIGGTGVGVYGGSIIGCPMYNIGSQAPNPPQTPSEIFGITVEGKTIEVTGNSMHENRTGGSQFWDYGVRVTGGERLNIHDNPMYGIKTKRIFVTSWTGVTKSRIEDIIPPQCRVKLATSMTLPSGAWTDVPWDGEDYDDPSDPMHSTVTNNHRVNILWPGRYRVTVNVRFPNASDATRRGIRVFYANGGGATAIAERLITAVNGDDTSIGCDVEVEVSQADIVAAARWFEVELFQNKGTDMTIAVNDVNHAVVRRIAGMPMT